MLTIKKSPRMDIQNSWNKTGNNQVRKCHIGQAFGIAVRTLPEMPTSHVRVPGLGLGSTLDSSFLLITRQQVMVQVLGS